MRINLIPMAGAGLRFVQAGYKEPKPLIDVSGEAMIVRAARALPDADRFVFVCRAEHIENYPLREVLNKNFPNCEIIDIDYLTEGQASTCLLAEKFFDMDGSLMIGACDNGMVWDKTRFQVLIDDSTVDAIIFTFRNNATVKRNPEMYGWVRVDADNAVERMSVKIPISDNPGHDHAVVGAFWFRKGKDFVEKTKQMIENERRINNEFYVDKVFDEFVEDGMRVKVFEIDKYICWGTPNDLKTYQYWENYFKE